MTANWAEIKADYINGGGSYRELAKKHGVSASTLMQKAAREKWKTEAEALRSEAEVATKQKAVEKIAESESDILAIKSRLRLKMYEQIERRMASADKLEGQEFRRLVQSYKDMCEIQSGAEDQRQDEGVTIIIGD